MGGLNCSKCEDGFIYWGSGNKEEELLDSRECVEDKVNKNNISNKVLVIGVICIFISIICFVVVLSFFLGFYFFKKGADLPEQGELEEASSSGTLVSNSKLQLSASLLEDKSCSFGAENMKEVAPNNLSNIEEESQS